MTATCPVAAIRVVAFTLLGASPLLSSALVVSGWAVALTPRSGTLEKALLRPLLASGAQLRRPLEVAPSALGP